MIFAGLQCDTFAKTRTEIDMQMRYTEDSARRPKWYDYGAEYDNTKISFTIVADTPASLEAIVREQSVSSEIGITFEGGEWLYTHTGDFCIIKYDTIERLDRAFESYGLTVTVAPISPLNYTALSGDRTECVGAGYLTYAGARIPQPGSFDFGYKTRKYAGVTHGSAYSSELPTVEHDSTVFSVSMLSGNMRSLVDKVYSARGSAIQVTFPAYTFPFGIARGSGELLNELCVSSQDVFVIETEDSYSYAVTLGLIELKSSEVPTETVYYFEAGTALHPFAGSVGSPVSVDPNWSINDGTNGWIDYLGEYSSINDPAGAGATYDTVVYNGKIEVATVNMEVVDVVTSEWGLLELFGVSLDDIGSSRFSLSYLMAPYYGAQMLRLSSDTDNVEVDYDEELYDYAGGDVFTATLHTNGTDVYVDYEIFNGLGVSQISGTLSVSGNFNALLDYAINIGCAGWYNVRCNEFYVQGAGFPYSKEVPII